MVTLPCIAPFPWFRDTDYLEETITPTGTNDTITGKSPYMFRACFNDSFQGQIVANYAINNLKVKSAAVMIDAASDYSKGLAASFKKSFEAGGGKVTVEEKYQQKDTEFNAQLSKIKSSGAEIVFVPGYPPELPLIIKQAGIMGLKARFCGADGWDNDAVIQNSGEKIIGSFIVGAFSREDKRDIVQNFVKNMSAEAGSFSALGYDAVGVVVEASKSGTDRESIKKGMLGIKNYEGVTGTITITENGDATKSAVVLEIYKDGDTYKKKFLTTVNP